MSSYSVTQSSSCRWASSRTLGGWFAVRCSSHATCTHFGAWRPPKFAARAQSLCLDPSLHWLFSSQRRWTCRPKLACIPYRSLHCRWYLAVWALQLYEAQPSPEESLALSTGTLSFSRLHKCHKHFEFDTRAMNDDLQFQVFSSGVPRVHNLQTLKSNHCT